METINAIYMFIIGIFLGSFFNVLGYRIPKRMSIIKPGSHCPECKSPLKVRDLVPILSYIFLRGKCRYCKKKISIIYPIFELITGLAFLLTYYYTGFNNELIINLTLVSLLITITISDFYYMVIPDTILVSFLILLIFEKILLIPNINIWYDLLSGFGAMLLLYIVGKLGAVVARREALGGGDIKLFFVIGFMFDYVGAIVVLYMASILALPLALYKLRKTSERELPFGPFIALASFIYLLYQTQILELLKKLFYI